MTYHYLNNVLLLLIQTQLINSDKIKHLITLNTHIWCSVSKLIKMKIDVFIIKIPWSNKAFMAALWILNQHKHAAQSKATWRIVSH